MKYRTEWKYICNSFDLDQLQKKIEAVLDRDENATGEAYHIRSLYFDDYINSCAFDNDAGASERYKWRIRYYNDDHSLIKLEKKVKKNDLCFKKVGNLDEKQYRMIIDGDIAGLMADSDDRLVQQFCGEYLYRCLKPVIIVDYERQAFVEPISNIRITFDRNIAASLDLDSFLDGDYLCFPIQNAGQHVLEVKFDDILPEHIEKLVHTIKLSRNTFSKYYLSRLVLERNIL